MEDGVLETVVKTTAYKDTFDTFHLKSVERSIIEWCK